MNAVEFLLPELQSSDRLKDITLSRRSIPSKSIDAPRKRSERNSKRFIPFAQERDSIGRLIRTNITDAGEYQNNSTSSKSYVSGGIRYSRRGNNTPDISPIGLPSTTNIYRLAENNIMSRHDDEILPSVSPVPNYINISANTYSIGRANDNSLEVKSPKNRSSIRNSPEPTTEYLTDMTRSAQFEQSAIKELETVNPMNKESRSRLPPLHINKSRSGGMITPSNFPSSMSSKNLRDRDRVRDEITVGNDSLDSVGSYINLSAWRFEASQIAQNKDVENMLKREKKSLTRVTKLTKPQRTDVVPPLGVYQPTIDVVRARPSKCLILPAHSPQSGGTSVEHKHEKCVKLVQAETRRKPVKQDDNHGSEQYYKHLFRGMLREADQKTKSTKKEDRHIKGVTTHPELDYILIEDFTKFPGDFEKKMVDMKRRIRVMKEKLNAYKEYKDVE